MERKYLFEAGLNVYTSFKTLITVEQLKNLESIDTRKYHLYSILAFPQMFFRNEQTSIDSKGVHICLFSVNDGIETEYFLPTLEIYKDLDYCKVKIATNFPYVSLDIEINDKNFLISHPEVIQNCLTLYAHDLFMSFSEKLVTRQEFEVLYIGQSYGKQGERTAITRLSSHSTLQKILIDCQFKYSGRHIYLLLLEISPLLNMSFDGISKKYTKSIDESDRHMENVLRNLPEEQQIVNIAEAALIHYFKPEYNRNFVENFPNENHKGYKQYFDLDYNQFSFELDLEFDSCAPIQLYSSTNRINSCFDFVQYKLHNDPNRLNMYEMFKS